MKTGWRWGLGRLPGAGWLAVLAACSACAQSAPGARMVIVSSGPVSSLAVAEGGSEGQILREIDDPNTGDRWLLVRNGQIPGGPGRLVLAGTSRNRAAGLLPQQSEAGGATASVTVLPVIRAGDRLIVVEHTAVVDAVLEARALAPAVRGASFDVRLTIGGRVMRAMALGPGHAELEPQNGVQQ